MSETRPTGGAGQHRGTLILGLWPLSQTQETLAAESRRGDNDAPCQAVHEAPGCGRGAHVNPRHPSIRRAGRRRRDPKEGQPRRAADAGVRDERDEKVLDGLASPAYVRSLLAWSSASIVLVKGMR